MQDWPAYRRSAARLARFAEEHEVAQVLGSHIEMTDEPGQPFPLRTTHQPGEHPLPLGAEHVAELRAACEAMSDAPRVDVHDDFVVTPLG